ncbi:MAG: polyribonucleotide nucleotidyltransferase, partial [Betaproteobacteria bacterium]|nr:polyribonucleotide nucleotidyltransferase [Betaproteobacteria bacterium]
MSKPTTLTARVGDRDLHIESGKYAKLADGAALVTMGETIILVTAVSATKVKEGQDFFPLTVEYKEKAAAAGRIPGSYFRREGRPTEKEILTCRMVDRPLRPLFPKGYFYDTQVIAILLSTDGLNDPDILAINGASAALMVSDIPWAGPIAGVRVARVGGKFIVNPTHPELAESDLDLVYVGTEHEVLMIEGAGKELPEADFKAALEHAHSAIQPIIKIQKELAASCGKPKRQAPLMLVKDELLEIAYSVAGSRIEAAIYQPSKVERHKAVESLKEEVKTKILEKFPAATPFEISQAFDYLQKKAFRTSILDKNKRCDGRPADQVRNLTGEVGFLPRAHGSSLFARGETQAVCLATLGPLEEAQEIDAYTG